MEINTSLNALTTEQQAAANKLEQLWKQKQAEIKEITGKRPSQEDAAYQMGFKTQGGFNAYIKGRIPLGMEQLLNFSEFFGVKPDEIYPELAKKLRQYRPTQINEPEVSNTALSVQEEANEYKVDINKQTMIDATSRIIDIYGTDILKQNGSFWTATQIINLYDLFTEDPATKVLNNKTLTTLLSQGESNDTTKPEIHDFLRHANGGSK